MSSKKEFKTDINNCARCGGQHVGLTFSKLTQPHNEFTYFSLCPGNSEPILLSVTGRSERVKAPQPTTSGLCPVCGGDLKGEESHATYACDTCSYTLEDGFASIDESDVVDSAESPGVHILKVTQVLRLEKSITVLVKADSLQEAIDIQTERDAPSYYDPRWHVARCDLENESVTQA